MKDRTRHARRRPTVGQVSAGRTPRADRNEWYRITNLVDRPNIAVVYIYDVIGCMCWWGDDCQCMTARNFIEDLQGLRADEVHIHINSPGGEVDEGNAIYNTIRKLSATVRVFIDGIAASAASLIAMAGDEVTIAESAQVMIHDASTIAIGDAAEMHKTAELLDRYSDTIAAIYAKKAGGTVEEWRERMRAETWFTGAEAVEVGLADRTDEDESERTEALMTKRHDLTAHGFRHPGRENAPDPLVNHGVQAEPEAPAAPEPPVEPAAPEVVEPEPEAVVVPEPSPSPENNETTGTPEVVDEAASPDSWAGLTNGLLSASPVPAAVPSVGDLLNALKEGLK
jgi:ATP-dependent protease ClpP protease subunit